MPPLYWLLLLIGVLMSAMGGLALKAGAVEIRYDAGAVAACWQIARSWKIWLGLILYFIPVGIWIFMLKKIELSFLQPLFSLVYVVTPVLAALLLHEQVSAMRWGGIAVVVLGVWIIARG